MTALGHTDAQIAAIAASVKEWGWTTPVLVGEDGGLIAGHARILAARQLGIAEIPVMVAAGWSEAQKRAYVVDFGAAFVKLLDFGGKLGCPIVLGDFLVVEIAEAPFDALDLLGQFGRNLRRLRAREAAENQRRLSRPFV
jgi:hypothetical protein